MVVPGCRSDAMLASDAPTLGGFVRGSGCFSFHMRHTWNGCGNAPSDAVMPLLTGARGEVIVAGSETEADSHDGGERRVRERRRRTSNDERSSDRIRAPRRGALLGARRRRRRRRARLGALRDGGERGATLDGARRERRRGGGGEAESR